MARLVEIITGQRFGDALQSRLFTPLDLQDTGFVLRPHQVPRMAALYRGDLADVLKPGLQRLHDTPWPGAFVQAVPRQSGAHWWLSPATGLAGVVTTQRHFGFWHPFWFDYKRRVYEAVG